MLLIPTEEKHRMVRKILKIELVILVCIIAIVLWRQGYLFCPEASARRMMAVIRFRREYLSEFWRILVLIWWSAGFLTTIFLIIYGIAGQIAESVFDRRGRVKNKQKRIT